VLALHAHSFGSELHHPGALQNPDPKAAAYFASYISKAYAALTDDVSRQNYEKYGHPDGPQVRR
jgi:translocation protein SEC63